jgi:hypothetical protein
VIEVDGNGVRETRRGGTLTGETEVEPEPMVEPEPELKPKLVTWRLCVRVEPDEIDDQWFHTGWFRSGAIPEHWYPVESYTQPIETVKQLPEREMP